MSTKEAWTQTCQKAGKHYLEMRGSSILLLSSPYTASTSKLWPRLRLVSKNSSSTYTPVMASITILHTHTDKLWNIVSQLNVQQLNIIINTSSSKNYCCVVTNRCWQNDSEMTANNIWVGCKVKDMRTFQRYLVHYFFDNLNSINEYWVSKCLISLHFSLLLQISYYSISIYL